jgi:glycerol-3-phosphate acyltransferase PlsY
MEALTTTAVAQASAPMAWDLGRSLLAVLVAYLLGSLPSAYLAGRAFAGLDIRKVGSGNMGATNVFRTLGAGPGALVLGVDMAKGWVAVAVLPGLMHLTPHRWDTLVCGLAVVLGHNYTCFLGFKGGKGVASSAGVFLGLEPLATLIAILTFGGALAFTRMVSVGSLAAAMALPLFIYLLPTGSGQLGHLSLGLAVILASSVWIKHIPNIRRILAGTENRIGSKPQAAAGEGKGEADHG